MPEAIVKEGRVQLRDAEGTPYSVPKEEAAAVLAAGQHRLETADEWNERAKGIERGTLTEQAKTFGEGALEGATLGVGTALATELGGEEYRQAAQERAEVNPTVRTVGSVTGAVVPGLLSGGSGTAGSLARLTPAGQLARGSAALETAVARGLARAGIGGEAAGIGARIVNRGLSVGAGGALEGAAIGTGQSLADSALEGTEWTAERALAGLEDGTLYGLAGGAALGGGAAALGGLGRKAVQTMLGEGTTLQGAIKGFANKRAIKQVVGEDVQAFRKITRNGDDMARIDELANKLRARGVLDDASPNGIERAVQREIDDADAVAGTIGKSLDDQGIRPDTSRMWKEIDDQAARLREAGTADHKLVARKLERQVEQFRKGRSVRFARPDGTISRIQTDPTFTELRQFKTNLGKTVNWAKQSKSIATEEMERLYGSVARNLDEAARAAGPDVELAWSAANRDMDDFITLRSGMKREAQRKAKGAFFKQGDQFGGIAGALASMATGAGAPATILAAMAGSVAHKFIRERGSAALGKLADRVARSELGMRDVAKALAGGKVERLTNRAAIVARSREEKREDYKTVRQNLLAFQQNPETVTARIEKTIAPIAQDQPEVAVAMATRIAGDYAWLASKLPPPMTRADTSITPAKEVERFTARQEIQITNYAEALAAPRSVFESIRDGHVNWDGIEALKARRPELWEAQRQYVIQAMNEAEDPPGFRKRVLLGLAFDFPADYSMANVKRIQATYAMPPDTGNGKPAMAGISNPFEQQQSEASP